MVIAWALVTRLPALPFDARTSIAMSAVLGGVTVLLPPGFGGGSGSRPFRAFGYFLGVILGLIVVGFFAFLFTPWARRLGPDLRFWLASYALYLLAVFFPQSSTFPLLVPMLPALGAFAVPRAIWYRVGIVLLFIAGQWGWIHIGWWVDGYDWTPP